MKLYHITLLKNKKSIQTHGLLDLKHNLGIYFTDNPKKSLEWIVSIHDLIFANPQEKYLMVEVDYDEKIHKKWNNSNMFTTMMNNKGDEYICLKSIKPDKIKLYEVSYEHDCKKYKKFKNLKKNPIKISWMDMVEISDELKYSKPSWNQIVDMSWKHYMLYTGVTMMKGELDYTDEIFGDESNVLIYKNKEMKKKFDFSKTVLKNGWEQHSFQSVKNMNSNYLPTKNII